MSDNHNVINNPEQKRFEIDLGDNKYAFAEYSIAGKNIIFTHTEVPVGFEGQGIATKLADVAMTYAKDEGLKVQALCPFFKKYVTEHPEYHDITWGF
ncbi:MAG: GNAT family N-acetyltransferase [Chloroflexota bacterium]